jgi:intracellular multiplication protein IcmV
MKIKLRSRVGGLISRIFKVRQWADVSRVQAGFGFVVDLGRTYLLPKKEPVVKESFDEAMARFQLTEQDLVDKQHRLFRLSLLMLLVAVLLLIYVIYNLFSGHYMATFISIMPMSLALGLAFRYHFWSFQLREHRLGCTLKQWFKHGLIGAPK